MQRRLHSPLAWSYTVARRISLDRHELTSKQQWWLNEARRVFRAIGHVYNRPFSPLR